MGRRQDRNVGAQFIALARIDRLPRRAQFIAPLHLRASAPGLSRGELSRLFVQAAQLAGLAAAVVGV